MNYLFVAIFAIWIDELFSNFKGNQNIETTAEKKCLNDEMLLQFSLCL